MNPNPTRRRSAAVAAPAAALLAAALLGGCGSPDPEPDYVGVCKNHKTGQRVDDKKCEGDQRSTGGGMGWVFIPRGSAGSGTSYPAVGQRVTGGTTVVPAGKSVARGGIPAQGGSVVRGGFGGKVSGGGSVGG